MLGVQPMAAVHPGSFARTIGTALVLLNGTVLGVHSRPHAFVAGFRLARRRGLLSEFASIVFMQDSIQISVDGGRLCRPLVICSNGQPRLTQEHVNVRPRALPNGHPRLACAACMRTSLPAGRTPAGGALERLHLSSSAHASRSAPQALRRYLEVAAPAVGLGDRQSSPGAT